MDVFPPVCHEGGYGDGYVLLSFLMVPAADAKAQHWANQSAKSPDSPPQHSHPQTEGQRWANQMDKVSYWANRI